MLANIEARTRINESFSIITFVDWGEVRVNKDNDIPGAASPNSLTLKGAGITVGWAARFGLNVQATYAHRIGDNPNPTSNGNDQDGTLEENRVWVQASMSF